METLFCPRCNAVQYHTGNSRVGWDENSHGEYTCQVCKHTRGPDRECQHSGPDCVVDPATRGANTTPQMLAVLAGKQKRIKLSMVGLCLLLLLGIGCFLYKFTPPGFFGGNSGAAAAPNPSVSVNPASAGAVVPVVLVLGGNRGANVIAAGYPKDRVVKCADFEERASDRVESASSTTGARYDPKTGHYTYTWKTSKSWAGTCRELVFKFSHDVPGIADGQIVMDFRFS